MRKKTFVLMMSLLCVATLAQAADLSDREKALLKTIIRQSFRMNIRSWLEQSPDQTQLNRESHRFVIALSNSKDKEEKLLTMFNEGTVSHKLLPAQALAYLGNNIGINVLEEAALPTKLIGPYTTQSGFEISESALCLLYLGFDFPVTFKFSKIPNPLYSELDIFLKK